RLHEGRPVRFDANFDVAWAKPGSDTLFEFKTHTPLVAKVKGVTRFFEVKQTGEDRSGLIVKPLPKAVLGLQSEETYAPRPGEPFYTEPIITSHGIAHLNQELEPVVKV